MLVEKLRKGPWFEEEDERLNSVVSVMGQRRWDSIAKASDLLAAGLRRSGKSCRLRWMNYLRPNLKRGRLTAEEVKIVVNLHQQWGNKWSKIARRLPGRTDNEIKNYWRSHLRKRAQTQEKDDKNIKNNEKQEIYKENSRCARIKDGYVDTIYGIFNGDEIFNTKDSFGDVSQLSSYEITSSPYENRYLSDWLNEQNDLNYNFCTTLDTGFCYPVWNSGNNGYSLWQSSSSLWTD